MRRSIATLLLPLAALTACATASGGGSAPSPYSHNGTRASSSSEPMRVRLHENFGDGLVLQLNRPAYTAVFQIVPGQGVALVYPDIGQRAMYNAGQTRLTPSVASNRFWRYDNAYNNAYSFASSIHQGPRHLLVIASERPLQTSRFRGGMLRRVMGTSSYTTTNSRRVVDDLLAVVVPPQPDESWDADVITVWPRVNDVRLPSGDLYRVRCRSGGSVWVPLELAAAACRNPDRVLPQPRDSVGAPPRSDTTGVRKPGGRRPEPETGVGQAPRQGTRLSQLRDEMRSYRNASGPDGSRPIRISDLRRELDNMRSGGYGSVSARLRDGRTGNSPSPGDYTIRPPVNTSRATAQHDSPPPSGTHSYTPGEAATGGASSPAPKPDPQPAPSPEPPSNPIP
ncbi:MAG TPA: hypothetical protein VF584_10925 [Longimicrobium sp.]|jgi:hypothetical protein